jgi:hypothetical protein
MGTRKSHSPTHEASFASLVRAFNFKLQVQVSGVNQAGKLLLCYFVMSNIQLQAELRACILVRQVLAVAARFQHEGTSEAVCTAA